jgi:hypothetical protein
MGTRAVYTFRDNSGEQHHVYKHWDGYPEGAAQWIVNGLKEAWELPRYEADDMAAAFITANKRGGGDIRLMQSGAIADVAPSDIAYWYEVWQAPNGQLIVKAWAVNNWDGWKAEEVFYGRLADFAAHYSEEAYQLYRLRYPSKTKEAA